MILGISHLYQIIIMLISWQAEEAQTYQLISAKMNAYEITPQKLF